MKPMKTHDERAYELLLDGLFPLRDDRYPLIKQDLQEVSQTVNQLLQARSAKPLTDKALKNELFLLENRGVLPNDDHRVLVGRATCFCFSLCGFMYRLSYWPKRSVFYVRSWQLPFLMVGVLGESRKPYKPPFSYSLNAFRTASELFAWAAKFLKRFQESVPSHQGFAPSVFSWTSSRFFSLDTGYQLLVQFLRLKKQRSPLLKVFSKLPPLLKRLVHREGSATHQMVLKLQTYTETSSPIPLRVRQLGTSLIPNGSCPNAGDLDAFIRLIELSNPVFAFELEFCYLTDLDAVLSDCDRFFVRVLRLWGFILRCFRAFFVEPSTAEEVTP